MTEPEATSEWKPPYISYVTLANFIDEKLGANPLPPRIDRAFLDNYAGSIQFMLLTALRTMGLIGEAGEVKPSLHAAVENPGRRKAVFREWAEPFYAEQIALAKRNGTASMLWESFTKHKLSGSTMRKAVVFYLSLSEDVGLPKSPHFRPPRQVVRTAPKPKKIILTKPAASAEPPEPVSGAVKGERKTISLGPPGSVTISVDVRWLDLPDATFTALRKVIRDLEALGTDDPDPDGGVVLVTPPDEDDA